MRCSHPPSQHVLSRFIHQMDAARPMFGSPRTFLLETALLPPPQPLSSPSAASSSPSSLPPAPLSSSRPSIPSPTPAGGGRSPSFTRKSAIFKASNRVGVAGLTFAKSLWPFAAFSVHFLIFPAVSSRGGWQAVRMAGGEPAANQTTFSLLLKCQSCSCGAAAAATQRLSKSGNFLCCYYFLNSDPELFPRSPIQRN